MSKIDQYILQDSQVFSVNNTEEKVENLQLTLSPTSQEGIVTGKVTTGTPATDVADAVVKIFDTNDVPIAHTITNATGQYNIPAIVKGSYKITACKNGFLTPVAISISVNENRPTTQNITLTPNADASLNLVFGIVKEAGTTPPIVVSDAIINIYSESDPDTVIVTTHSNSSGQYLVPYLANGNYIVKANKAGFEQTVANIGLSNTVAPEFAPLDLPMTINALTNTGTINGFITYQGSPIPDATVALYLVSGTTENIVQMTKTNNAGRYLFGNVLQGSYIVKAFSQTSSI